MKPSVIFSDFLNYVSYSILSPTSIIWNVCFPLRAPNAFSVSGIAFLFVWKFAECYWNCPPSQVNWAFPGFLTAPSHLASDSFLSLFHLLHVPVLPSFSFLLHPSLVLILTAFSFNVHFIIFLLCGPHWIVQPMEQMFGRPLISSHHMLGSTCYFTWSYGG